MQAIPREIVTYDWVIAVFIIAVSLLAIIKLRFEKSFYEFMSLPVRDTFFGFSTRENKRLNLFNSILFFVQMLMYGFLILLFIHALDSDFAFTFLNYIMLTGGYLAFFGLRYYLDKLLGAVFELEQLTNQMLKVRTSYHSYIGWMLIVVNLVLFFRFRESVTIIGITAIVFFSLSYLMVILSMIRQRQQIMRGLFYFFLYLCSLEILPYIALYKRFM